jgi:hypothetical protein
MNALTHGLTSQTVVLPTEDLDAYHLHLKSYTGHYNPADPTEADLVRSLADDSWRKNRVAALEEKILDSAWDLESQTKMLSNLSIHSGRLSRQYERTINQLRALQKIRRDQEKIDLDTLLNILEIKDRDYNPEDDGFVFTDAQIQSARLRRRRENLAKEASLARGARRVAPPTDWRPPHANLPMMENKDLFHEP